jgi:tetratricopeptide (TPR) repeat protein
MFSMRPELQTWAESIDGRLSADDPRGAEVKGVVAIGAWFRGDHQRALAAGAEALAAAELVDGAVSTIWAHTAMLNASGYVGDFDGALAHLLALRKECRATGDPYWLVNALATQAVAYASVGMHEEALRPAARAVQLAEELDNPECRYWATFAQALALRPTDLDGAEAALERALAAARSNGSRFNEGVVLIEQLSVQVEQGRLGAGAATALDLLGHLERAGGYGQVWQAVGLVARLLADGGRTAQGALLLAAVAERPRLPAPQSDVLIEGLAARLEAEPGAVDLGQIRARAAFLTDAEIIDSCRRELEALLRT